MTTPDQIAKLRNLVVNYAKATKVKKYATPPYATPKVIPTTPKAGAGRSTQAKNIVAENPHTTPWGRFTTKAGDPSRTFGFPEAPRGGIHPAIAGTRLAVVLNEIKQTYGKNDPHLAQLAESALNSLSDRDKDGSDVYTRIRDRLNGHANTAEGIGITGVGLPEHGEEGVTNYANRARELATGYNWHRIGHSIQVDNAVRRYVQKITENTRLGGSGQELRAAHNIFGLGKQAREARTGQRTDNRSQQAFMNGLREHIRDIGVSGSLDDKTLLNSLRRVAEAEHHHEILRGRKPGQHVAGVEPRKPAYTIGSNNKPRVKPGIEASQYRRIAYTLLRYAKKPPISKPAPSTNIDPNLVEQSLGELKISPKYTGQYVGAITRHLKDNPGDVLTKHYHHQASLTGRPALNGVRPLVGYFADKFGHKTPRFSPYLPTAHEDLLEPEGGYSHDEGGEYPIDLAHLEEASKLFRLPYEVVPEGEEVAHTPAKLPRKVPERIPGDKRASYHQSIANALAEGTKHDDVISMLMDRHGLSSQVAARIYENYKNLKTKPEAKTKPNVNSPQRGKLRTRKFALVDKTPKPNPDRPGHGLNKPFTGLSQVTKVGEQYEPLGIAGNANRDIYPSVEQINKENMVDPASLLAKHLKAKHTASRAADRLGHLGELEASSRAHDEWGKHADAASRLVRRFGNKIFNEANKIYENPTREEVEAAVERHRLGNQEPIQHAAYRAPAGGMIARGTAYKGGEMVPNMEGKFMNPPKYDRKKLAAAKMKWHLKVKKLPDNNTDDLSKNPPMSSMC